MRKYYVYAMAALMICLLPNSPQPTAAMGGVATITGKVFFGQQMGGQSVGPCSDIMVVATAPNKTVKKAATGAKLAAKQCNFTLTGVPAGVPVNLAVVYSDLISKPDDTHPAPAGKWKNPLTLKPNATVTKYLKLDGKP